MKSISLNPQKLLVVLAILLFSFSLVNAAPAYNAADAIKTIMSYKVSASSVVARSASEATETKAMAARAAKKAEMKMILATATSIYDEMDLEDSGLSRQAFQSAWTGYYKLRKKGLLHKSSVLSICDFSQSSSNQRLYVIDVRNRKVLYRTYVAHGINSGEEFANSFSNKMEDRKSVV